jgi:hypothetical protein
MDQSLLLNVIRRPLDGNDWKGDVKSRCGYCVRLRRRVAWRRRSAQDDRPTLRSRNAAARSGRDRSHGLRRLLRPTTAYRSPRGAAIQRFGVRNVNGATTVFGVVGKEVDARCRAAWLHVALPDPSERRDRLGPCGRRAAAARADAHHRRPLQAPRAPLPEREARVELLGRSRLERDADAARPVLREPAAHPGRSEWPVRAGRRRHLGVLTCADRLGARRPDRDPRHERAVVDRSRSVERLHPPAEHGSAAPLRPGACGHAGADQEVGQAAPTRTRGTEIFGAFRFGLDPHGQRLESPAPLRELEDRRVVVRPVRDTASACKRRDEDARNAEASLLVLGLHVGGRGGWRHVIEEACGVHKLGRRRRAAGFAGGTEFAHP